jgi:uncharacterized protein (TIGR02246 family)
MLKNSIYKIRIPSSHLAKTSLKIRKFWPAEREGLMKRLFYGGGFVCLIAILLPACAPAPEPEPETAPEPVFDQAAEEAAIRELAKQIDATWNAHDAKACAALNDEIYENWDGTVKGPAADEEMMADLFRQQPDLQRRMLEEIGIVFVTPDVAIYKLRMEISGWKGEEGQPPPPTNYLRALVLAKRDGKWRFVTPFNRPIEE